MGTGYGSRDCLLRLVRISRRIPTYKEGTAGFTLYALPERPRVHQFRQEIPDIVIEDWKDKLPPDEPLHENGLARYLARFRDTRGANYATDALALASFGIPYPNIGSLELLYTVLTGKLAGKDESEFQKFVDWTVQSEII